MKLKVDKQGALVSAVVELEKEEWQEAQKKAVMKLAKKITVPGFRKGNAPYDKVKSLVDSQKALEEAIDSVLPKAFKEVLKQEKDLHVLIQPAVDVLKLSAEELVIKFAITTRPEVVLGAYKDIEIKKDAITISDEEINKGLEDLRQQCATISLKEGGVIEKGDLVNFDFIGYVDGKPFDGGKGDKYELEIGSKRFVPGFEEQMLGLKKGEEAKIVITFPKDYVKDLAGKEATFELKINEISVKTLPEIDDELALDANIEGVSNLTDLQQHLFTTLSERKEVEAENKAANELIERIVANATVEIPQTLVENELPHEFEHYKKDVESKGIPFDKYLEIAEMSEEKVKEQMRINIAKSLKVMFTLGAIAEANKIEVTEEDINQEFELMAKQYGLEVEKIKEYMKDQMEQLANQIYSRKVTDYILSVNKLV